MNTVTEQEYEPARKSDQTQRALLRSRVNELQIKLAEAQDRHARTGESQWVRLGHQYERQLDDAQQTLEKFDARQTDLDERRVSSETAAARKAAHKAAAAFEKKLLAAANAGAALQEAAAAVVRCSGARDPGIWPHHHLVDAAVQARVIDVMGAVADVKLPGYGTRPSVPLDKRFE